MTTTSNSVNQNEPQQITSVSVLGARLLWLLVCPMGLAFNAVLIVSNGGGWVTRRDASFAVLLLLAVLGRWWEQRSGQATTASGEPSTSADCRSYILKLSLIAALSWVMANLLGAFFFN